MGWRNTGYNSASKVVYEWNLSIMLLKKLLLLKVRWNQKADCQAADSPKKQTGEFVLFAVRSKKANKTNSSVHFLGVVSRP